MTPTVITVHQHLLRANVKNGTRLPCIAIRRGRSGKATLAHQVLIKDATGAVVARLICRLDRPLACGARIWLETELPVEIVGDDGD